MEISKMEAPHETYFRIVRQPWPGGDAPQIRELLDFYSIGYLPGSSEANLCLQGAILADPISALIVLTGAIARVGAEEARGGARG